VSVLKRFRKTESYKVKQVIFLALFVFLVALVWLAASNLDKLVPIVSAAAVLLLIVFLVRQYDFLITLKEFERAVIFRFGRINRVGGPGWTIVIPLIESFRIVDLRTHTIDIPKQQVITKDNIVLALDAVIYLFVRPDKQSVINSVIEVRDYESSAESFVQATIRDVAGTLALPDLISNIGELNIRVQKELEKIANSWGVTVEAVQIQQIVIPKELEDALTRQKSAEQQKLARMQLAEANKIEIDAVREAAEHLNDKSLSYYYIRALEKLGEGQSTKFVLPIELTLLAERIAGGFKKSVASEEESLEPVFRKYLPLMKKLLAENGKK
jgi:regulator of protease activity HflC (stomatin/prohibitin superfamily)